MSTWLLGWKKISHNTALPFVSNLQDKQNIQIIGYLFSCTPVQLFLNIMGMKCGTHILAQYNQHTTYVAITTQCGHLVSIRSHSGGPGFKCCPGDQLSWLGFVVVFFSLSKQMQGWYLKLGHDCFFTLIHYTLSPIIQCYTVWLTESTMRKL
jgi:hypothetical protein